jgi:hypothetical protein
MKYLKIVALLVLSISALVEESQPHNSSNTFKYNSIGFHVFNNGETGIEAKLSLPLPGPLYFLTEAKADDVSVDDESYERLSKAVRIGVHAGVGDVLNSISIGNISFKLKNFMDIFMEVGIKVTDFDNDNFSENNTEANVITGVRFGDSNGWEGKIFADLTKETEIVQFSCPKDLICTSVETSQVSYILDDETDKKYGFTTIYNFNNNGSFFVEIKTSTLLDSSIKIGYQLNF